MLLVARLQARCRKTRRDTMNENEEMIDEAVEVAMGTLATWWEKNREKYLKESAKGFGE